MDISEWMKSVVIPKANDNCGLTFVGQIIIFSYSNKNLTDFSDF
jgi:hypothetical protein